MPEVPQLPHTQISTMAIQPEIVEFISCEHGDDLIVSFAIRDEPLNSIVSLTLVRTPKYEPLLPPEDRGVSASHENNLGADDDDRLESLHWEGAEVRIETRDGHRYRLDASAVPPEDKRTAVKVLRAMHFDHAFRLRVEH